MFDSFTLMWLCSIKEHLFLLLFNCPVFSSARRGRHGDDSSSGWYTSSCSSLIIKVLRCWSDFLASFPSSASLRNLCSCLLFGLEVLWLKTCLLSVKTVGLFPRRCLTCELNKAHCLYIDADVSPTRQHAILRCKGRPPDLLFSGAALLWMEGFNPLFVLKHSHWTQPSDVWVLFSVRLLLHLSSDINFQ